MFRRTLGAVMLALLFTLTARAQLQLEAGEMHLRGILSRDSQKKEYLVLNEKTRAMKTLTLVSSITETKLADYPSGTAVEVCLALQAENEEESNQRAEVLKIRPLGPDEAVLIYTGVVKSCKPNKGCSDFGQYLEAPMFTNYKNASELSSRGIRCSD